MYLMLSAKRCFEADTLKIACTASIQRSADSNTKTTIQLTTFCLIFPQYPVFLHPEHKLLKFEGGQLSFICAGTLDTWRHQQTSIYSMWLMHTFSDSSSSEGFVLVSQPSNLDSSKVVVESKLSSWSIRALQFALTVCANVCLGPGFWCVNLVQWA